MNEITETLDSNFVNFKDFAKPIKCNELKSKSEEEKESYRIEQSWNSYKGLINNVLESTAFYYTKKQKLLSLAIETNNNLPDIIYVGQDDGSVLKMMLNTISSSNLLLKPVQPIQHLIVFSQLSPVTHLQVINR